MAFQMWESPPFRAGRMSTRMPPQASSVNTTVLGAKPSKRVRTSSNSVPAWAVPAAKPNMESANT